MSVFYDGDIPTVPLLLAGLSTKMLIAPLVGLKSSLIQLGLDIQDKNEMNERQRREIGSYNEEMSLLELLPALEMEDCYKRVICSASSGQISDPEITSILNVFQAQDEVNAPLSNKAWKFVEAKKFGEISKSVPQCEERYECGASMELIQKALSW